MNTEKQLPVIYGITEEPNRLGLQAYAIDGQTGEILEKHFCSSAGFAKSDLGFTEPIFQKWDSFSNEVHSTVGFNKQCHKNYGEKYPDGFRLEWIGPYSEYPDITRFMEQYYAKQEEETTEIE